MTIRRGSALVALALMGALALLLLGRSAASPPAAHAASCQIASFVAAGDTATLQGQNCSTLDERFVPYCAGGTLHYDYWVETDPIDTAIDTTLGCGSAFRLVILGNGGNDTIDMLRIAPGTGFSGQAGKVNLAAGGAGADTLIGSANSDDLEGGGDNDQLFARDGVHDSVVCDSGTDYALADQGSLDAVTSCESLDALPEAAKGKKSCKKKHRGKAATAKKCRKKKR
jgi:hypothetical protein